MRIVTGLVLAGFLVAGQAVAGDLYYPKGPAPAGDPVYSHHSMFVGDVTFAAGVEEENLRSYGGGRFNFDLGTGHDLLIEATGSTFFGGTFAGYAHFYKDKGTSSVGVFLGAGANGSSGFYTGGVEGTIDIAHNTVLGGRLGFVKPDISDHHALANIWLDHYFSPVTRLRAAAAFSSVGSGTAGGSLQLAHQFKGGPFVGHGEIGLRGTGSSDHNAYALFGVTMLLDNYAATLQDHDRNVRYRIGMPINY